MAGWGVPDWSQGKSYPAPDELPDDLWRWEFLRRNPEYRDDWEIYAWETYATLTGFPYDQSPDAVLTPNNEEFVADIPHSERRYGLKMCPNPRNPRPNVGNLVFENCNVVLKEGEGPRWLEGGWRQDVSVPEGFVLVQFDLATPWSKQEAAAKYQFESLQRARGYTPKSERPKRTRMNWPIYLRLLDARDQGASWREIAATIWPNQQKDSANISKMYWDQARPLSCNWPR